MESTARYLFRSLLISDCIVTGMDHSKFISKVIKVVGSVPRGKVVSYGQVALYVGIPRAARQVGWTLNRMERKVELPWWRVVNNQGRISIKGSRYTPKDQKELLEQEGIRVREDLTFEIEEYRFIPENELLRKFGLDMHYLEMISDKVPYNKYFVQV